MAKNLAFDDKVIAEVQAIDCHKKSRSDKALQKDSQHKKQLAILALFNSINWADDYCYKTQRQIK